MQNSVILRLFNTIHIFFTIIEPILVGNRYFMLICYNIVSWQFKCTDLNVKIDQKQYYSWYSKMFQQTECVMYVQIFMKIEFFSLNYLSLWTNLRAPKNTSCKYGVVNTSTIINLGFSYITSYYIFQSQVVLKQQCNHYLIYNLCSISIVYNQHHHKLKCKQQD